MFSSERDGARAVISTKFGGYHIPSRRAIAITVSWSDGSRVLAKRSTFDSAVIHLEFLRPVAGPRNVFKLRHRISRALPRDTFRSSNADAIRRRVSNGRLRNTFLGGPGPAFRYAYREGLGRRGLRRSHRREGGMISASPYVHVRAGRRNRRRSVEDGHWLLG